MIRSSKQLKALVQNLSKSTGIPNYILIRRYIMERFLERLSQTQYSNFFILKGGMLISNMVGFEARATKDIDTTITGLSLTEDNMRKIIQEILSIDLGDNIEFSFTGIRPIMDEMEYEGLRVVIDSHLDNMNTPLKIDISTGDIITPQAITYDYSLMFEKRTIAIKAYSIETVLAEKIETMISRSDTNTRMRDFYDMHILLKSCHGEIDNNTLRNALIATSKHRGSLDNLSGAESVLKVLENSILMAELWHNYQMKNSYAIDVTWDAVMISSRKLCLMSGLEVDKPSILKKLNVFNEESKRIEKHQTNKERINHFIEER